MCRVSILCRYVSFIVLEHHLLRENELPSLHVALLPSFLMNTKGNIYTLKEPEHYRALSFACHNYFYGANRHTLRVIRPAVTTPVGMKWHLMTSVSC